MSDNIDEAESLLTTPYSDEALYLTRIPINHTIITEKVKDYADMLVWHKVVMSCFPDNLTLDSENPRSKNKILFRLDYRNAMPNLIIQSAIKPLFNLENIKTVSMIPLINKYKNGQKVHLEVILNSIRTDPKNGKRVSVKASKLEEWVLGNSGDSTLKGLFPWLDNKTILDLSPIEKFRQGAIPLSAASLKLEGSIGDLERSLFAVKNGVGKAKSYGFGLITMLPIAD